MKVFGLGECHGRIKRSLDFGALFVTITRRAAGSFVAPHSHAIATYLTLLQGRHQWTDPEGHIRWSAPGTWYFREPRTVHQHERCPTDILSLGIQADLDALGISCLPEPGVELRGVDSDRLTRRFIAELSATDSASELSVRAAVMELHVLLVRAGKGSGRPNSMVNLAREIIDTRFLDRINLSVVATAVGVHPSHLARGFRSQLGVSVGDYIRDRRLEWARTQLANPDLKIAQIAADAGFSDQSHLTRLFTARYGKSPGAMRLRD